LKKYLNLVAALLTIITPAAKNKLLLQYMKKIISTCWLFCCVVAAGYGQSVNNYDQLIKSADSLYRARQFKASAVKFNDAFNTKPRKVKSNHPYNAACSWALAGNRDSAFYYLNLSAKQFAYSNLEHITSDSDLQPLYKDARWNAIIEQVGKNKIKAKAKLNKPLIALLDSVYKADQDPRSQIDSVEKTYGLKSKERSDLFVSMAKSDSSNLIIVLHILTKYGWLGTDIVGENGNKTIWLVVQHADLQTQIKYLPQLRKSVEKGLSPPYYLALTEDRIALQQGKDQIYGSQYTHDLETGKYSIYPIRDEAHVDERRKAMGMAPLADEAKLYGIDYFLPK